MYEYKPKKVCARKINFDIKDGKLSDVKFVGGCNGNLKALGALLEGMEASEAVKRLKGIQCQIRGTSCSDQLAAAIEKYL